MSHFVETPAHSHRHFSWDQVGVVLTTLCLIHCLALPVLLALLPALSTHFAPDERIHWALSYLATPVVLLSLRPGYRKHHRWQVMALGLLGLAMIFVGPLLHASAGEGAEQLVSGLGGAGLISAHLLNRKLLGVCQSESCAC